MNNREIGVNEYDSLHTVVYFKSWLIVVLGWAEAASTRNFTNTSAITIYLNSNDAQKYTWFILQLLFLCSRTSIIINLTGCFLGHVVQQIENNWKEEKKKVLFICRYFWEVRLANFYSRFIIFSSLVVAGFSFLHPPLWCQVLFLHVYIKSKFLFVVKQNNDTSLLLSSPYDLCQFARLFEKEYPVLHRAFYRFSR